MDNCLSLIKNRLFKNISWLVVEKIIRMGLNFVIFGLLARYLGVSKFGTFSYFLTIVYLLNPFWSLGINQIVKDKLSKFPDDKERYIWSGILIKITTSIIIFLASIVYVSYLGDFFESSADKYLFLVLLFSYLFRSVDVLELWFDSQIRSKYSSIAKSSAFMVTAALYGLGIFLKYPLVYFGICYSVEFLLVAFGLFYIYSIRDQNSFKFSIKFDIIKHILILSLPIFFADIAITTFTRINQVMLNYYLGKSSVGIFAASMRLTELWLFIVASISITFFSPIVIAGKNNPEEFKRLVQKLFRIVSTISFAIVIVVFIFSTPLVNLIFGAKFSESAPILRILIWSNIFVFWSYAQEPWDISRKMLKFRLFRVTLGAITNVVLNIVLIPISGVKGAAYATLISYSLAFFLCNICTKKSREIFIIQLKSFQFWKLKLN